MTVGKVKFRNFRDHSEILEYTKDFMLSLADNYQLIDFFEYPVVSQMSIEYLFISLNADSIESKYFNRNSRTRLSELQSFFGVTVQFEKELASGSLHEKKLAATTGFIVYDGGLSPIKELETFEDFPVYLLPPLSSDNENYFDLLNWQRDYSSIYRLWFRGGVHEDFFYTQLSDYHCELSQQGLNLREKISSTTGKDCSYHLFIDPSLPEPSNASPRCNSTWKLAEPLFDTFTFLCKHCFIVS